MANSFWTPTVAAKEFIRRLEAALIWGNLVNKDYSSEFTMKGNSVKVRRPMAYLGQANNLDITGYREDITEGMATVTMDKTLSIPVSVSALDRTLSFDRWSEMVLKPAAQRCAEAIEASIVANYYKAYWFTGTPGTIPATFSTLADAGAYMTDVNIGQMDRIGVHTPASAAKFANDIKGVYVQGNAKSALEKAAVGPYGGFSDNYTSVFAPIHTVGGLGGTPLVNGGAQGVTYAAVKDTWTQTLITDGWTAAIANRLNAGDVFTLPNVFSVNNSTKASTGRLQPFTVMAAASSDGAGNATLTISPPIITSGAHQTVTAAPADNAPMTILSGAAGTSYRQSLLLDPSAFVLVTRPLDIPSGSGLKSHTESGNAVTVSVSEFVDGNTLAQTMRFDMLWGTDLLDQRKVMRLTN